MTSLHQHSSNSANAIAQSLSFDDVADFFSLPLYDAASTLGVCASVLKKLCRENGLDRWPHRKFLAGKSTEEIKRHAARERRKEIAELSKIHMQNSQLQNNEPSKSLGIEALPNLQLQGTKNIQSGQAQNLGHQSLMIGMTMSDEFKYGFPYDGLSSTTNKWWGSSKSDDDEEICVDGAETEGEEKSQYVEKTDDAASKKPQGNGGTEDGMGSEGLDLLTAVRKRVLEEGQKALKLGVCRGSGIRKLGRRESLLLLGIFQSSLPEDWMHSPSQIHLE